MGYQSKTYSLSDEVVEAIEAQKLEGVTPDRFLWSLIFRKKKPSKRLQAVGRLRASDPMAGERPEIEYGSEELPSGGSVIRSLDAIAPPAAIGKASTEQIIPNWRAGRKPLLRPGEKK